MALNHVLAMTSAMAAAGGMDMPMPTFIPMVKFFPTGMVKARLKTRRGKRRSKRGYR